MWVARFKLRDDEDIYSPLCARWRIDFYAVPYTAYEKAGRIHLLVGGVLAGSEDHKKAFLMELKKSPQVMRIEQHHDFILIHAMHPISRESRAEIKRFYNPQYIKTKPVLVSSDGWEYWELACVERGELNKIVLAARKHYHGALISMKQETLQTVTSLEFSPLLSEKQMEALRTAFKEGYYTYPRSRTIPQLARISKRSYSTFQEHLRKAENKLVDFFLKYR